MSNLLDKASIILTPTAYNNGEALCVKPSDGSGDFDFSRNSAATRVNAQGLVENVQILSSNLVQNGDFSEEGVEEVSNGSFSQEGVELLSQPVNLVTDFTTNSGGVIVDADTFTTSGGAVDGIKKLSFLTVGKSYKLIIKGDTTSSGFTLGILVNGNEYGSGFGTHYFKATTQDLWVRQQTLGTTNITSFSIVEVAQNWSLGTGWSIGEDKAVCNGSGRINPTNNSWLSGKTYKFDIEVSDRTAGYFRIQNPAVSIYYVNNINSNGTYTYYINTIDANGFVIEAVGFIGSITNISVKEVGQNWTLGTGWSIAENKAVAGSLSNGADIRQVGIFQQSKKYKISIDADKISGTNIILRTYNGSFQTIGDLTENSSFIYTTTATNNGTLYIVSNNFTGSVTNISVIEITDDTNLPRINYEGFSYQDALGSELVTNGDFATDSDWSKGSGWSISGALNAAATTSTAFQINTGIVSGKTYNVTYTISNYVSGSVRIELGSGNVSVGTIRSANGTYTEYIVALGDETIYFDGIVSFTGSIDNVSVKEYLGQEPIPNSGCGHWLWEPQSTNLVTQSELFSDASWRKANTIVSDNSTISVDGTQNATLIQSTTSTSAFVAPNNLTLTIGNTYTFSCFAKKGNNDWIRLAHITSGGTGCWFDLENGVVGTVNSQSATIEDYGNGWYRCTNTFIATSATSLDNAFIGICDADGSTNAGIVGQNDYLWGAMLEQNSYATSYIPTEGSTVTRNQDVCTNGGSLASINSTEGVLYAEIAALADDLSNRQISLNNGTTDDRIQLYFNTSSNRVSVFYKSQSGATQFILNHTLSDIKQFNKLAFKWKQNDFALWSNGLEVATQTSGVTSIANTLTNLDFQQFNSAADFFGKTKAVAVWKEALSDAELTELTTI